MREKYPKIRFAELQDRIFIGQKIREIINDDLFEHLLTETEKFEWLTFKILKAENYKEIVEDLMNSYQTVGCNISLKIHFLNSHLDFFPPNLGAVSNEKGERFHQLISAMEQRYGGK